MPKIKLKTHLNSLEIGIGNVINLKIKEGERLEVAQEIFGTLMDLGHFDLADDNDDDQVEKENWDHIERNEDLG
jgi:hypothetical protein